VTTLVDLDAVTVAGYRLRTGDETTEAPDVTGALAEAQTPLEEELRRDLALQERTESMVIDCDGRMYPKAWPITACATNTIDGRTLLGGTPDVDQWLGLIGYDGPATRRATITYTGGFDADTLPVTLRNAIYDLARADLADAALLPVGASSVSVGDVSVSYTAGDGTGGALDEQVPGLWARVKKYRARWV
jgi:hypothetical protein